MAMTGLAADALDLSGRWALRLDAEDRGVAESWFAAPLDTRDQIALPGTTDRAGFGEPAADLNPGHLTRPHRFVGPAWYERTIEIPKDWVGQQVDLFLERVLWESRVWIDGQPVPGEQDSLGTPHVHELGMVDGAGAPSPRADGLGSGRLQVGKHRLTIRVDNRMIHPIGDRGHCYTEFTQSIWNGLLGRMELRARPAVSLGRVRVFPAADRKSVRVEAEIRAGTEGRGGVQGSVFRVQDGRRSTCGRLVHQVAWTATGAVAQLEIPVSEATPWDEFAPTLYELELSLNPELGTLKPVALRATFGFRTLARDGNRLLINGRPSFMRGNMDCAQYPREGHPPLDVEGWRRVFRIYQSYGINQVRFHSWCPPEAAFIAADEMGLYLQPEVLWIDGWMGSPNARKDMDTPGYPKGVGKSDRTIDAYVRAEMRRMLDTYGNHPSFCFFAIGNELGSSDFKVMGDWIAEEKARDPRRLYAASTARAITPADDFADTHNLPGLGSTVNQLGVPHTDWDYQGAYGRAPVPTIAHESGQMPVHPDWREIAKYTGPLKATGLDVFRAAARSNGVEQQSADFQKASGHLQSIIYKGEMEALLRSPGCAGISWLSVQDFPGQGEALVGWLDSFLDNKGYLAPADFRRYSATTVPLARFAKYTWTTGETFTATIQVAHWGRDVLKGAAVTWSLGGQAGRFAPQDLPVGTVTALGVITQSLAGLRAPQSVDLRVEIEGTDFHNTWSLWVYPDAPAPAAPANVLVTERPAEAWSALEAGARVVLLAHAFGEAKHAAWMPLFWSSRFFPGQHRDTLGALVRAEHPALAQFPTGLGLDWQWHQVCEGARGFVLDDQPAAYRPIVQPISDFHFNHKLGSVFEFATAGGGRLLACGYDLVNRLAQRPAARQLRTSLLAYAAGPAFRPDTVLAHARFQQLFPSRVPTPLAAAPAGFESAVLYVRAGARHPGRGDVPWRADYDEALVREGFGYDVTCNAVWKDDQGVAWWGAPTLRVTITCAKPELYDLHVHFHDWNRNGRSGVLEFEGRTHELGPHTGAGTWVKLDVLREDALDGRLVLDARVKSGPNLQITALALVPKGERP
jgi:beta-galactosidase